MMKMEMKIQLLTLLILLASGISPLLAAPPENSGDVIKHLEFMGYEVSMDDERILANHSSNLNILIKSYRGGMLVTSYFRGTEYGQSNKSSWLTLINELNQNAAAARYYVDNDGDMAIEAYYPGDYNKKSFSAFLDAFNLDRDQLSEVSDEMVKYVE
jgi:hypothetical protein